MSCGLDKKAQEDRLSLGFLSLLFEKGKGKQKVPRLAVQHSEMNSVPARPWEHGGHFSSSVPFLPRDLAATLWRPFRLWMSAPVGLALTNLQRTPVP